ncbi:excalibur calcium-binding domain-containing protein [Nocardia niigatensis]
MPPLRHSILIATVIAVAALISGCGSTTSFPTTVTPRPTATLAVTTTTVAAPVGSTTAAPPITPIVPLPSTPVPSAAAEVPSVPAAAPPPPAAAPAPAPETTSAPSVYYRSCADAKRAGAAPLYRGDPGYRSGLDRDGDGIACEK